jgi:hypothetical protein
MTGMISRYVGLSYLVFLTLTDGITERYAHVAYGRSQGCGKVTRRLGTAIALDQRCGRPFDLSGESYYLTLFNIT